MFRNNSKNKCLEKVNVFAVCLLGNKKSPEQKLSFSHETHLFDLIYVPAKNYQVIANSIGVIACTRFWYQGCYVHNGESESILQHDIPIGPYLCPYQILSKYFKPRT